MKKLIISLTAIVLLTLGCVAWLNQQWSKPLPKMEGPLLTIATGTSVHKLVKTLQQQGWQGHPLSVSVLLKLKPALKQIKAGVYHVAAANNIEQLLQLLVAGKEHHFNVQFIEGSTFKEWRTILAGEPHLQPTLSNKSDQEIAALLGIAQVNPEGWFFPDTYAFTAGTTDLDIFRRAYQAMQAQLDLLWQNRAQPLPYDNPYQALIMASIIEKETGLREEQAVIASVFVNRLRANMRLQTDPTIIYGLGERYTGDITYANIREKTAYNTYQINGLPPTPIAMPGKHAIAAALNPADTDYLYFVAKGQGAHYFSTSLSEHNAAVQKYILGKE